MHFITISRETGSLGDDIARVLSSSLGFELITRDFVINSWISGFAGKYELRMLRESPRFYLNECSQGTSFAGYIEKRLTETAEGRPVIILGLAAQVIFQKHPGALNIKIVASNEVRIERLMKLYGLGCDDARKLLELSDRKHKRYISTIYGRDWSDPMLYHMLLNTDHIDVDESVQLLSKMSDLFKSREQPGTFPKITTSVFSGTGENTHTSRHPFAHPSEEEFSRILDMYNIQWEYEPRTFPVEWDAEGNVTMAFTPDFYLSRFNTYIELTTMDQKYVAEKKRKLRRLRELYPGININIVYKNDYHTLLNRFRVWNTGENKGVVK